MSNWNDLPDDDAIKQLYGTTFTDCTYIGPPPERPRDREPWLEMKAGGQVNLCIPDVDGYGPTGSTHRHPLTADRMRSLHTVLGMFLRMAGHEPDPTHPWFHGLAVEGKEYRELRSLCGGVDLDSPTCCCASDSTMGAIAHKVAGLIQQAEVRVGSWRAAHGDAEAAHGEHPRDSSPPLPPVDLDPESGP